MASDLIASACYKRDEIIPFVNAIGNAFTKWIPIKDKELVENNGHKSMPSTNAKHYLSKLYSPIGNLYIKKDANFNKFILDNNIEKWNLEFVKTERIGSLDPQAIRQIGALHGQAPGEDIYKLVLYGEKKENEWVNRILSLVTDDEIELFNNNVDEIIDSIVTSSFKNEKIPESAIKDAKKKLTKTLSK